MASPYSTPSHTVIVTPYANEEPMPAGATGTLFLLASGFGIGALVILFAAYSLPLKAQFQFVSPMPGSRYHNPEETIILGNGSVLDENRQQPGCDLFRGHPLSDLARERIETLTASLDFQLMNHSTVTLLARLRG